MIADAFRRWKHARRIARAEAEIMSRDLQPRPHGLPSELVISLTDYIAAIQLNSNVIAQLDCLLHTLL